MAENKKNFFGKLIDKIDCKLEEKAKEKKKGCCGGGDGSCCK